MRKIREVLRLSASGLSQHQIARSCSIAQSTVQKYLALAKAGNLAWPLPDSFDDNQIAAQLIGIQSEPVASRPAPDFAVIHQQRLDHKDVTLQLLWQEYRQQHADGFGYSRFCELYSRWCDSRNATMRFDHTPGEKMFVDYAGATIAIHNAQTGEIRQAAIFVAVLGYSSYTYAEATWTQQTADWIQSHIRALEFFQGVPSLIVPDNARTGVSKACRYDPDLNPTYHEMAVHYQTAVMPARPRKPRDKAKVEVGVQVVQRWIIAALRHRTFFSLDEANAAIAELLAMLNHKPFRKRPGTRTELFQQHDRPALKPLPAGRYELGEWSRVTVDRDYHVLTGDHFYSVPYQLIGQTVDIRLSAAAVEILHRGRRVASHVRGQADQQSTTLAEHRPKSHQHYVEWTPSKLVACAESVGPQTALLIERILTNRPHPEIGFRCSVGVMRLASVHGAERLEAAAARAMHFGLDTYASIHSILRHHLETQPLSGNQCSRPALQHENLRGAAYYDSPAGEEPTHV
jgi:transposase